MYPRCVRPDANNKIHISLRMLIKQYFYHLPHPESAAKPITTGPLSLAFTRNDALDLTWLRAEDFAETLAPTNADDCKEKADISD